MKLSENTVFSTLKSWWDSRYNLKSMVKTVYKVTTASDVVAAVDCAYIGGAL